MTVVAEQYSIMAKEADDLMFEYIQKGEKPPRHVIEQSRYYLNKRIEDYKRTHDLRPLLDYRQIPYEICSVCQSITITDVVNPKLLSREEIIILISKGVNVVIYELYGI